MYAYACLYMWSMAVKEYQASALQPMGTWNVIISLMLKKEICTHDPMNQGDFETL